MQYNSVDNAVGKLAKMQEFFDLGYSTSLEIALDIEESNATGESSPEVEQLKKITLEYVQMEKELKQWQQAAEMTKTAFGEEYKNAIDGSIPSIEDIFMSKLNEIDTDNDDLLAHPKAKEFIKQIWNVNHKGQPLPTEQIENDDSDLIIAQASEESIICPLTQKQMVEPVSSKNCKHNYEKEAIIQHIRGRRNRVRCPVGGCANYIVEADLQPNTGLAFRIKRLQRKQ